MKLKLENNQTDAWTELDCWDNYMSQAISTVQMHDQRNVDMRLQTKKIAELLAELVEAAIIERRKRLGDDSCETCGRND